MGDVAEAPSTKRNLLGILVDAVTYDDVVERVIEAARAERGLSVSATAVHGVMEGVHDPAHGARLNEFDILTPDGQPVRWALNWLYGTKLRERVYGPELMLRVCERGAGEQLPVYLYGSTPDVLEPLQHSLRQRFGGLRVAGASPSRFRSVDPDELDEIAVQIRASGARVVFVGLGCPRQETFVWAMRDRLGLPMLAVGAAFNFHAGLAAEAPHWMQRCGLQWLHRLARNPRRLWRRYLLLNPEYVWRVAAQRWGKPLAPRRSSPQPDGVPV